MEAAPLFETPFVATWEAETGGLWLEAKMGKKAGDSI
jgi:hypothetical protein